MVEEDFVTCKICNKQFKVLGFHVYKDGIKEILW